MSADDETLQLNRTMRPGVPMSRDAASGPRAGTESGGRSGSVARHRSTRGAFHGRQRFPWSLHVLPAHWGGHQPGLAGPDPGSTIQRSARFFNKRTRNHARAIALAINSISDDAAMSCHQGSGQQKRDSQE